MNKEHALAVFEDYKIRRIYDEQEGAWYFSVIDVVGALTDSVNPRDYWFKMKIRVKTEDGFELSTICRQLKLTSSDGKKYMTDCAGVQGLLKVGYTTVDAQTRVAQQYPTLKPGKTRIGSCWKKPPCAMTARCSPTMMFTGCCESTGCRIPKGNGSDARMRGC